jgi:hypothetical protein
LRSILDAFEVGVWIAAFILCSRVPDMSESGSQQSGRAMSDPGDPEPDQSSPFFVPYTEAERDDYLLSAITGMISHQRVVEAGGFFDVDASGRSRPERVLARASGLAQSQDFIAAHARVFLDGASRQWSAECEILNVCSLGSTSWHR